MALDKRAWRCQKGHGAQEKGHGAAPCYFALDLTLGLDVKKVNSNEQYFCYLVEDGQSF